MADDTGPSNPLLSTKPSDSNLTISLHPLVLLTISDYVTRHRVRSEDGPILGALLGQQTGREITIEHAFQCKSVINPNGEVLLDQVWFEERLQQYKDVHKAPALDFVGWFTLCPETGPMPALIPIHKQVMLKYNESALLLAFHSSAISSTASSLNGKLPLTVYETAVESDHTRDDSSMQVDGEDTLVVKFKPVPYAIETDETEMIAIDYVAKGAGSAAAVTADGEAPPSPGALERAEKKGKKRADKPLGEDVSNGTKDSTKSLSTEEEDQIAGLTTRLNSVRMLHSRLSLLSTFIRSQSPSYLTTPETPISKTSPDPVQLPHLRNIQALLTRLSLLTPSTGPASTPEISRVPDPLTLASQSQSNDVALSSLLAILGQDVQCISEAGRKFATVDQARQQKGKGKGGLGAGTFAGMVGDDVSMGGMSMMV